MYTDERGDLQVGLKYYWETLESVCIYKYNRASGLELWHRDQQDILAVPTYRHTW
jgi:hypothetical protein